ncbi:metal-dependent hydrolase [Holophaga foetida]|uniref:metal-dependent hydrolase n=1 Tax=Holophaga foetida TaxID=35839 RepID=UPI000247379E|nr:metal-dependent hydrolase [Holophaga foetida]
MPSFFGHVAAGATIHVLLRDGESSQPRTRNLALFCALAPDLDWFMSFLHLSGRHVLNHRGVTHSLAAALLLASLVMFLAFRKDERRPRVWICMVLCALSHCLLDACTLGGVGVAVFLPVTPIRFVCAWQPIQVGPIPLNLTLLRGFLGALWTEAIWIGVPAIALVSTAQVLRFVRALRIDERIYETLPEPPILPESFEGDY